MPKDDSLTKSSVNAMQYLCEPAAFAGAGHSRAPVARTLNQNHSRQVQVLDSQNQDRQSFARILKAYDPCHDHVALGFHDVVNQTLKNYSP